MHTMKPDTLPRIELRSKGVSMVLGGNARAHNRHYADTRRVYFSSSTARRCRGTTVDSVADPVPRIVTALEELRLLCVER